FLVSAIFKGMATGDVIQHVSVTHRLTKKNINKSLMKELESSVEEFIKSQVHNVEISDLTITSISFLGEMTEAEYNS
ncbi:hypothetical protein D3X58_15405, partial [Acinetobacter baumannii]